MKTYQQKRAEALEARNWVVVDATDIPLGRLASQVVAVLRGKNKATYTKHVDGGDFVIVTNASKVKFTGAKSETKKYYWHTEYLGGIKDKSAGEMVSKHPERVISLAVRGMLPRGPLGFQLLKKLKVVAGADHTHKAQTPKELKLKFIR